MQKPRDLTLGDGATFSRPCPDCACTVTILTPSKNGWGGDPARFKRWRDLVRAQVPWPLLCDGCKAWWNLHVNDPSERS